MTKCLTFIILASITISAKAQTTQLGTDEQPYGKVSIEDLELKTCDFEKDANAEVLFSFGKIYYGDDLKSITEEVHKRIKIFNENGNKAADIRIEYYAGNRLENITGIEAQTINLADGKTEVTKLDKKLIYNRIIDKEISEITFTMPNVKPGCIIEYKYKWNARYNEGIPTWYFQEDIPVKYSELNTSIPDIFYFRPALHIYQQMAKHTSKVTGQVLKVTSHSLSIGTTTTSNQETETYNYNSNEEVWGLENIPAFHEEAYTSSFADNVERLSLYLVRNKPIGGFDVTFSDSWAKVGGYLSREEDFGDQLNRSLNNEQEIIAKANLLKTNDDKISFIFNEVKNAMKWNMVDRWYTNEGTARAWDNKTGNSTEINLVLYHLLKKSGIDAYPMVVSTRKHGRVDPYYTSLVQFNRTVVYIPVDSTKSYVLDATHKYNSFNEIPSTLLNSMGLYIDRSKKTFDTVYLKKDQPVRYIVLINAEIKPGGKLEGTAQINSSSYDRINAVTRFKTDGEKKYIEYLADGENNLKIASLTFNNMETDTLPLVQNINFNQDLTSSDENYIYLNANIIAMLKTNPFISETRLTDIYFGFKRSYSINGLYKIPAGYKVESLPKNLSMFMTDKSIGFKRLAAEQDGSILVHYTIDIKKAAFSKEDYPEIRAFYKKMFDLLNEQVVLKKG